jgi:hypothetical protein
MKSKTTLKEGPIKVKYLLLWRLLKFSSTRIPCVDDAANWSEGGSHE